MTTAAQNDHGISAGHVLPQLRLTRPTPARGVLSPLRVIQQLQHHRRSESVQCAGIVETFLYIWTVVAILLGFVLPCLVLYLIYFKDGGDLMPVLSFKMAAYSGLGITLAAGIGLYGLLNHRECVTKGSRNYGLGTFVLLGALAAIVMVTGGAMSLSLVRVVDLAEHGHFSNEQVADLETTMIRMLDAQVKKSSSVWSDTENNLQCCGYDEAATIQAYVSSSSSWQLSHVVAVRNINNVGGRYCSSKECSDAHCPVPGRDWCRVELLQAARDSYSLLGICAVVFGVVQLIFSTFGLFTLLCDVRRQSGLSPTIELQHRTLSPIQPSMMVSDPPER